MRIDTARFRKLGLRPHVLDAAIDAWENQMAEGTVHNTVITVNDFELPENMRRSFTLDLANLEDDLREHEVMADGYGTGRGNWSQRFSRSQVEGSGQSVLGGLRVGGLAYSGSKPFGSTAEGLEPGINDAAHGRLIRTHGRPGGDLDEEKIIGGRMDYRSAGCMVLPDDATRRYRDGARREGGRFKFNFAPHEHY